MTDANGTPPPKRLHILDDEEIEVLYGRPCLRGDERTTMFTLTQPEKDLLASFTHLPLQLYFLLQLGYFKAKQLFFTFTFDDVAEDVTYLCERYFPDVPRPELRMPNKRTILKQRHQILNLFGYRLCTPTDRQDLLLHAQQAARISSKPVYVLRELLHYLTEQRLVKPGYTFLQEELVGKALTAEVQRLATLLHTLVSAEARAELDALLTSTDERYTITLLKRQPKDFSFGEMRREMARGKSLVHLYTLARQIVPHLGISREAITYYASLVSYYSVERVLSACLVAWATNMGLGRMGDISDIPFTILASTSDNFLRLETLKAANACISNAIAALAVFRHYDIANVLHSSSDGQKFETTLPTFNARHSPKYFGLAKGIVAYTLVANHVPVNAELIGAHDHESHFVFDLLFNNTTDIHPQVHSTDTHGTNQVNFALLHIFGYQFAPRYKAIQEKLRTSLYGFEHPSQYGDVLLKPVRKLNTDVIVEEWENLQRIFVSLALKTTTQSLIVHKLNSYARKNKTCQALWEYDNIISSLYLLDFVETKQMMPKRSRMHCFGGICKKPLHAPGTR